MTDGEKLERASSAAWAEQRRVALLPRTKIDMELSPEEHRLVQAFRAFGNENRVQTLRYMITMQNLFGALASPKLHVIANTARPVQPVKRRKTSQPLRLV